jgi:hypothetical protein
MTPERNWRKEWTWLVVFKFPGCPFSPCELSPLRVEFLPVLSIGDSVVAGLRAGLDLHESDVKRPRLEEMVCPFFRERLVADRAFLRHLYLAAAMRLWQACEHVQTGIFLIFGWRALRTAATLVSVTSLPQMVQGKGIRTSAGWRPHLLNKAESDRRCVTTMAFAFLLEESRMTAAIVAAFLALMGLGADAAMHTQELQSALHQVSDSAPGTGACGTNL